MPAVGLISDAPERMTGKARGPRRRARAERTSRATAAAGFPVTGSWSGSSTDPTTPSDTSSMDRRLAAAAAARLAAAGRPWRDAAGEPSGRAT